jgi:MFS family permease
MPVISLRVAILISCLFETISITGITSFYPTVASSVGVPTWLIGIIFSFCPFCSLLLSPFIPALLQKLGRRFVLTFGLLLLGLGNIAICFILFTPLPIAILLSFFGRGLVGMGYACSLITTYTILTSEYPEQAAKMIAIIEVLAGVGLTIGPTLGSVLFGAFDYFFACLIIGLLNLIMLPLLFFSLGKLRQYNLEQKESYSIMEFLKKPVNDT